MSTPLVGEVSVKELKGTAVGEDGYECQSWLGVARAVMDG